MWSKFIIGIIILSVYINAFSQKNYNIKFDNNIIHFETYGKGKDTVLIINGGPGMHSEGFRPLAKEIGKHSFTIIYDQRGTGKSFTKINDNTTITLKRMVSDIEAIRKRLNIENWVIFGHSFGGMLAAYYTTINPTHVKGLILSSSGGVDMELFATLNIQSRLTQNERDSLNYWNSQIANGDITYYARYQRGMYLAPAYLHNKEHINTVAERLTQLNTLINSLVFQNMSKIQFDCKEELKTFNKPVLIIQGEQDIIDRNIALKSHNIFQNSKLVIIKNCAHYGWLEQPKHYYEEINQFLFIN